jgi:hypothetical protein
MYQKAPANKREPVWRLSVLELRTRLMCLVGICTLHDVWTYWLSANTRYSHLTVRLPIPPQARVTQL